MRVKRHEPDRANSYKTVQTVLIKCTDCGSTLTLQSKPSLVTKALGLGCKNCKLIAAAERKESLKQASKAKCEERAAQKQNLINAKRERHCPDCGGVWESLYSGKHLRPGSKAGNRCPDCRVGHRSRSVRARTYGVDHHELAALMDVSGRRCMNHGCDRPLFETLKEALEAGGSKRDVLCVDHDHTTGKVRGLLCPECNFALGQLGDSTDRIVGLAAYVVDTANPPPHDAKT